MIPGPETRNLLGAGTNDNKNKKNGPDEEIEDQDLPNIIGQKVSSWFDLPDGKEAEVEGSILAIKLRNKGKRKGAYYHVKWAENLSEKSGYTSLNWAGY